MYWKSHSRVCSYFGRITRKYIVYNNRCFFLFIFIYIYIMYLTGISKVFQYLISYTNFANNDGNISLSHSDFLKIFIRILQNSIILFTLCAYELYKRAHHYYVIKCASIGRRKVKQNFRNYINNVNTYIYITVQNVGSE